MHQVALVQRILPHYRVTFFRRLHEALRTRGISLRVVFGQESPGTVPRTVMLDEDWAHPIRNRYMQVGDLELIWQPCLGMLRKSDLVVVEQANRLLVNYLLQAGRCTSLGPQLAYWGHGRNLQSSAPNGIKEKLKQAILATADWWFAYTESTKSILLANGFPDSRITTVNNTIDDELLRAGLEEAKKQGRAAVLERLGVSSQNVALYCGGLRAEKRLDFLLEAASRIRDSVPDFELIIVGDGPLQELISAAARRYRWIHFVGAKTGMDIAPYLYVSKLLLMPGLVGLSVMDSFIGTCPLVTTDVAIHSPEISYFRNGANGLFTANNVHDYAAVVSKYIRDDDRLRVLRSGCEQSARQYSMSEMVQNFAGGIEQCLAAGKFA